MLHALLNAAMFAVLYALADRFARDDDPVPTMVAASACALFGFLMAGWAGAGMALAWYGWRAPPWRMIPRASTGPADASGTLATYLRHALVIPMATLAAHLSGHAWTQAAASFALWTLFATTLASAYGCWRAAAAMEDDPGADPYRHVQLARGAVFGLCASCALA